MLSFLEESLKQPRCRETILGNIWNEVPLMASDIDDAKLITLIWTPSETGTFRKRSRAVTQRPAIEYTLVFRAFQ